MGNARGWPRLGRAVQPPPPFEIDAVAVPESPSLLLLALTGEFDLAAATAFRERVLAAGAREGVQTLVLDLSEVVFLDSSMLKEFLRANSELPGRLILCGMQPTVRRLFELTRTDSLFRIEADRAAAIAAAG